MHDTAHKYHGMQCIILDNTMHHSSRTDHTTPPRDQRKKTDPHTPDPYRACSKRAFDGEVLEWVLVVDGCCMCNTARSPHSYWLVSHNLMETQVKKWRRLLHEWDPPGEAEEEQGDDPEGMHTPGGRKRTRGAGSNKACSPDENAAPKRQTLSGGSAGEDLYGGMLVGFFFLKGGLVAMAHYCCMHTTLYAHRLGRG